jgi:hypothetical protein
VFQFSSIDFSLPYYSIHNAYYYVGWIRLGPDELEISDGGCLLHRLPQYCRGRKVGTSGIPYAVFADPLRFGPDPDPTCQIGGSGSGWVPETDEIERILVPA